jgi:hypothetical protein
MTKLAPVHHRELEKFAKFVGCKPSEARRAHGVLGAIDTPLSHAATRKAENP